MVTCSTSYSGEPKNHSCALWGRVVGLCACDVLAWLGYKLGQRCRGGVPWHEGEH